MNYFSGKGAYYGRLASTRHVNGERLKKQIYACDDQPFGSPWPKGLLRPKSKINVW